MEEKKFDVSNLYIVDFAKNLFTKKNIFAVIYLVLNMVIISFLMGLFFDEVWVCILVGIGVYLLTATVALSPLGEWLFRLFNGCEKIEDQAILDRLMPLFEEVKARAIASRPDLKIDPRISLYINESDDINAFAMGRRTVCVTRGLLQLSDDEIKAVLGHEFGHLATHDTDLTLLITVGNFIITAVVTVIRVIMWIVELIIHVISIFCGENGSLVSGLNSLASGISHLLISGLMWLWTQLGILLVMKSSRDAEYEADAFSCVLGYAPAMLSFFRKLNDMELRANGGKKAKSNIFAALAASHPDTDKRIARIESKMGIPG